MITLIVSLPQTPGVHRQRVRLAVSVAAKLGGTGSRHPWLHSDRHAGMTLSGCWSAGNPWTQLGKTQTDFYSVAGAERGGFGRRPAGLRRHSVAVPVVVVVVQPVWTGNRHPLSRSGICVGSAPVGRCWQKICCLLRVSVEETGCWGTGSGFAAAPSA